MRTLYYYHELEDMYEEELNDCYEPVSICGYTYDQGSALRKLDPIAFRCGVSEWVDEEFDEILKIEHYIMYCRKDENHIDDEEEE